MQAASVSLSLEMSLFTFAQVVGGFVGFVGFVSLRHTVRPVRARVFKTKKAKRGARTKQVN